MGSKTTILYIEDDINSQRLVKRVLTHAGYNVLVASCGLEGLDLAHKHKPDLILTDINLPDLSGREITVRLRAEPSLESTPIVALTAQVHSFERDKTYVAGVSGYLTKPVNVSALPNEIEAYIKGHRDDINTERLQSAQLAYNRELVEQLESHVRKLEANYQELRRIDRVKEDFIQLTAHELRTPLTTVYGYSRLMQTSPAIQQLMEQDADVFATVTGIVNAIERLHTVISEIITVSRLASGRIDLKPTFVDVGAVMQTVISDYRDVLHQRKLHVEFDIEQWPDRMQADRTLLELAFSNILSNAIKYTPDHGRITIAARNQENNLRLSVKDTGIGIDLEDQKHIFNRFYTAGDTQLHSTSKTAFRGGGLGLGLAICRGIVEAHGGSIWVESAGCNEEELPGSTFYIDLPKRPSRHSPNSAYGAEQ